jgi:hypothetical protein
MVRRTLASTAWVSAPREDRLPPHARNDGRAQGVLSTRVGGVDRIGFEEKRKDSREFDGEMCGEAACDVGVTGLVDDGVELVLQVAASDRESVRGDALALIAVADSECLLQDALNLWGETAFSMIADQEAAATQQMSETRLMNRLPEAPIGGPPIAHQHALKIWPKHTGRFVEAAAGLNRVHRCRRRRVGPQPLEAGVDFPSGFIGTSPPDCCESCPEAPHRSARRAEPRGGSRARVRRR